MGWRVGGTPAPLAVDPVAILQLERSATTALVSSNQPDNAEKKWQTQQDQHANDDFNSVCHGSRVCRSHVDALILLRKNKKAHYRFDSGLYRLKRRCVSQIIWGG